jgi:hypothetical protein
MIEAWMKIKCIACEALARPVYLAAATSPHIVDVTLLKLGHHNQPANLKTMLQAKIDEANGQGYDAVALAYALCGKATEGIVACGLPVVIPKAHDCITLFLGSRDRYNEQQQLCPGTYWYEQDYIERGNEVDSPFALGSATGNEEMIKATYETYVEKYGKDNADYLMEVMGAWQAHYQRAVYIDLKIGKDHDVEDQAKQQAARRGWIFERMEGDMSLIHRLLNGEWNDDFLVLQPGSRSIMTYDDEIIGQ